MLRYVTSTLTACALASTVSVFAQDPPPAQPERQQAETPQAPKEILTGCVMEAKTTDGGTAYLLNNTEGGSARVYVLGESPQPGPSQSEWATSVNRTSSPDRESARHRSRCSAATSTRRRAASATERRQS